MIFSIKNKPAIFLGSLAISLIISIGAWLGNKSVLEYFTVTFFLTFIIWIGNHLLNIKLETIFSWKKNVRQRAIMQIILNIIYTLAVVCSVLFIYFYLFRTDTLTSEMLYTEAFIAVILVMMMNAVFAGQYFFKKWKYASLEAELLKRETVETQLTMLKNNVNPHFFFNSLNTLASIIPEDPKLSVSFVNHFAAMYRYIFQHRDQELITVKDEVNFIESYIFLLKARFDHNLSINMNIDEQLMCRGVMPFSLYTLLENAVKFNVISQANPLTIDIYSEGNDEIIVRNNLQKKVLTDEHLSCGLNKIINRYKSLSREVSVIQNTFEFRVSLPLLPYQLVQQ